MATHTVDDADIGSYENTLTAATVDTVTLKGAAESVEVTGDGSASIFFTLDGTAPTVGGASCHYMPAAPATRTVKHPGSGIVVKLISSGTPKYSVARGD